MSEKTILILTLNDNHTIDRSGPYIIEIDNPVILFLDHGATDDEVINAFHKATGQEIGQEIERKRQWPE